MADGVLDWAKRQRKAWKTETKLLEKGYKKTFEVRDGVIVDTTDENSTDLRAPCGASTINQEARGQIMPKGPKGEKRPADVIGAAVKVAKIATGEIEEDIDTPEKEGKDPAAVSMGKRGGKARAQSMSPERRAEIAKRAAAKRWEKS